MGQDQDGEYLSRLAISGQLRPKCFVDVVIKNRVEHMSVQELRSTSMLFRYS